MIRFFFPLKNQKENAAQRVATLLVLKYLLTLKYNAASN